MDFVIFFQFFFLVFFNQPNADCRLQGYQNLSKKQCTTIIVPVVCLYVDVDKLARIVYRDEQEANRSRERCCCNAEEEENVYVYYSLLTFPALLHSFYINKRWEAWLHILLNSNKIH